ncbi:hypothetical protein CR513_40146, partial [Mucuna pruriens]
MNFEQLQELNDQIQSCGAGYKAAKGMDSERENGDTMKSEQEVKQPSPSTEHIVGGVLSDRDSSMHKGRIILWCGRPTCPIELC